MRRFGSVFSTLVMVCLGAPAAWALEDVGPESDDAMQADIYYFYDAPPQIPCTTDTDCAVDEACDGTYCVYAGPACTTDDSCGPLYGCKSGHCQWVGCTTDDQCGVGYRCNVGFAACEQVKCIVNTDCPAGTGCVWGYCQTTKGMCQSDGECPNYSMCDVGGSVIAGDAGSSGAPMPVPDSSVSGDLVESPDAAPPYYQTWGSCMIDVPALPEDAQCAALCAASAACLAYTDPLPTEDIGPQMDATYWSGGDATAWPSMYAYTAPSANYIAWVEKVCTVKCNFAMASGAGASETEALATCVKENPTCSAIETQCSEKSVAARTIWEEQAVILPYDLQFPPYEGGTGDDLASSGDYAPWAEPHDDWEVIDTASDIGGAGGGDFAFDVSLSSSDASASGDAVGAGDTKNASSSNVSGGCTTGAQGAAPASAGLLLLALGMLVRRRAGRS